MGLCDNIEKQSKFGASPTLKKEIDSLFSYDSAICKIEFKAEENGKIEDGLGTGFFCEINDNDIPFNKALFTNNHVLDEKRIEIDKEIEFEYLKKKYKLKITKNRKTFTNKELDYTCIEIFDIDKIENFFKIDKEIINFKHTLKEKEIFILQHALGQDLSFASGKIEDIKDKRIEHSVSTEKGSSGSPLIKRYNHNLVIGIHVGEDRDNSINIATPFDIIIEDIKKQLFEGNNNIINLIYEKKSNYNIEYNNNIFGSKFVKNNKENIKLIINGKNCELMEKYDLKEGINNIQVLIINKLTNLEEMFYNCKSLKYIDKLKYLDTREVNNFSYIFWGCSSLSDIRVLKNWDVSKGKDFSCMFSGCSSISDITFLKDWDVSKGKDFSGIFSGCSLISDIKGLQNWNVSNGTNFSYIFCGCSSLSDITALHNWKVSNGNNFSHTFCECSSLSDIKALQNWNVSNGKNFSGMFGGCSSLSDIKALQNWNVSNGIDFSWMFSGCSSLSDIKALQNYKVPKGNNFYSMFSYCPLLSDLKSLQYWNVSNKKYFSDMRK